MDTSSDNRGPGTEGGLAGLLERLVPCFYQKNPVETLRGKPRMDLAREAKAVLAAFTAEKKIEINLLDQRNLVTALVNHVERDVAPQRDASLAAQAVSAQPAALSAGVATKLADLISEAVPNASIVSAAQQELAARVRQEPTVRLGGGETIAQAKFKLQPLVLDRMDTSAAAHMPREALARDLTGLVSELLIETKTQLNLIERQELVTQLLDDMLGLGPLEPLLKDETISEIMVNGPNQVYVEHQGKLVLSDVHFRDNAHVLGIATRIVTAIGRRIDESSPLCDARLADGSRVNIIVPPLAIDGPSITIRKFSKKKITLDTMLKFGSLSPQMAQVLRVSGRCRLNILISGGTGSGKTTLLNALSQMIDHGERIVTIEDAAELQLQQPHVVRLETRPANLEGHGEITMRDLLKNTLRMRPDRIIVGETRGGEAIDMLQAMNTGHDGSLSTVHANRPREALMRLENMVGLGGVNLAPRAIRQQIASAIDMIIQVSRMRDGSRRITHISEVTGMEGEVISLQDLFTAEVTGELPDGKLNVTFRNHGLRPHCLPKAAYYGLDKQLLEAMA